MQSSAEAAQAGQSFSHVSRGSADFMIDVFFYFLCLKDYIQALPLSRHMLANLAPFRSVLAFAFTRPQMQMTELSLTAWTQLYESCAAIAQQCGLQRSLLARLINYKYSNIWDDLFPWEFARESEAQFMSFLWSEMMPQGPNEQGQLSRETFVKKVGRDIMMDLSSYTCQPTAVLAMDACFFFK